MFLEEPKNKNIFNIHLQLTNLFCKWLDSKYLGLVAYMVFVMHSSVTLLMSNDNPSKYRSHSWLNKISCRPDLAMGHPAPSLACNTHNK